MLPHNWGILIVIVLVLIFAGRYWSTYNQKMYEDYLEGFWIAEQDEFCKESGIASMMIYFGQADKKGGKQSRECYVVMLPDVEAQPFTLTYTCGRAPPRVGPYEITADCTFEEKNIWADKVNVAFDVRTGYLSVYADGTRYARVHKAHEL